MHARLHVPGIISVFFFFVFLPIGLGQSVGSVRGLVTLRDKGIPLHNATVLIAQLGRTAETDENGEYEFTGVPAGVYDLIASVPGLTSEMTTVEVKAAGTTTQDFLISISPIRQQVTVTASGYQQTTFDAFQVVTTLDSFDLAQKNTISLGDVLDTQLGVAKRSFGPGSSRPIIRGFDGDRVLILEDGIATGTLSSQSGDHGEAVNPSTLERLEVVKGPATLLYGSNAVGGVVNAVTGHHLIHEHPHEGLRGDVTGVGGSNNGRGAASASVDYGAGKWLLWGNGGGQRTGDYNTSLGKVENSKTRSRNGSGGLGWYDEKAFLSAGYGYDDNRYGVPFANEIEGVDDLIDIAFRQHGLRFDGGRIGIGSFVDTFRLSLKYTDYRHEELEGEEVATLLTNKLFSYRSIFEQPQADTFSGSFGLSGSHRQYEASGEEALTPPVTQNGVALFGLEQVQLERLKLQFGGRLEHVRYDPAGLPSRAFTGFSGAAGMHVPLWRRGAFVANYTSSFRVPALEELYNNGPHAGNVTFEIGNANLKRERSNGVDLSVRHAGDQIRGEVNFYYYDISDFVFLAPTGAIEDGLREAEYLQEDSRYLGAEFGLHLGVHPNLWLDLGLDSVNAKLKKSDAPIPRIPPLRGRIGFDVRYEGLSVKPEIVMADAQKKVFFHETPTPGYTVVNLQFSYTVPQQHYVHLISANVFNLGDRLYRNHASFIKDLAPEIGRGVALTYTIKFF